MEDLWRLSAADIAALIRSRKISAKQAASAALARLDAVNPSINAVIDHRPEDVLAQAGAVDAALARNEDPGPLAGVPVTVKVNIDQEGFATTNGLKLQRDVIAATNSPVIDNLRKAGAGVHGLRPTVGRIAAFNASLPERTIGPQISAVSGPLARTIGDLRIALAAMSGKDVRDPWWVPAPLEGPARPKRAALCLRPDGLETVAEVKAAVADAGKRLERAGWKVEEIETTPPLREAADLQTKLWLGDNYQAQLDAAEREGDPGALACLRGNKPKVFPFDAASFSKALTRRATLTREWLQFLEAYSVVLMPVSAELPFPDGLDLRDDASFARVWRAQLPQIAIPFMGLPALTVSTGMVGRVPVGVQVVSARYREDLCLLAGEAIEAGGTPSSPVDPVR